jgi:hypothetical protein
MYVNGTNSANSSRNTPSTVNANAGRRRMSRFGHALVVGPGAWNGCMNTLAKPQRIREIRAINLVDYKKPIDGLRS